MSSRPEPACRPWTQPPATCCGNTNAKLAANAAGQARTKNLAIYQDVVLFTAPDATSSAWTPRTGEMRWETKTDGRGNTSGPLVADGKVITGGACAGKRENCFILANDALTGKELGASTPLRARRAR